MSRDEGKAALNGLLSQVVGELQTVESRRVDSTIPEEAWVVAPGQKYSAVQKKGLRVFKEIDTIYAGYWAAHTDKTGKKRMDELAEQWGRQLYRFRIELIISALQRYASTVSSSYAPNLAQLLEAIHGLITSDLPPVTEAFQEAAMHANNGAHQWSHPVVRHAAQSTGYFLLRTEPEQITRPRFEAQYAISRDKFLRGEDLSVPNPVLIEDKTSVTLAETFNRQVEQLVAEHKLNPDKAADLCRYLMLDPGSRLRRNVYKQAVAEARVLGVSLPLEPQTQQQGERLTAKERSSAREAQQKLKALLRIAERGSTEGE